ncbi:MAG: hypothetical protein JW839_07945 [Candidatus Lokiarchaeota archaeon]|nr:hypothetical protein [Candidatus Lokiarchaeota archaeon]
MEQIGKQISKPFKEMFIFVMRRIGLILSAILLLVLMGAGVGVAIILRAWGLEYTTIVVPSLIIEAIACVIAYTFASNFFPKASRDFEGGPSKKGSRAYREPEEIEAAARDDAGLPERKAK